MICLGESEETGDDKTGILRLLNVLLSSTIRAEEKKRILEQEYAIAMTRELEGEVLGMCNLSKGVLERGKREGFAISIQNLMETLKLTMEQAMDALKVPEADREMYKAML